MVSVIRRPAVPSLKERTAHVIERSLGDVWSDACDSISAHVPPDETMQEFDVLVRLDAGNHRGIHTRYEAKAKSYSAPSFSLTNQSTKTSKLRYDREHLRDGWSWLFGGRTSR